MIYFPENNNVSRSPPNTALQKHKPKTSEFHWCMHLTTASLPGNLVSSVHALYHTRLSPIKLGHCDFLSQKIIIYLVFKVSPISSFYKPLPFESPPVHAPFHSRTSPQNRSMRLTSTKNYHIFSFWDQTHILPCISPRPSSQLQQDMQLTTQGQLHRSRSLWPT